MRVLSQLKNKNHRVMLLSAGVGATMICLQANNANAAAINVALANDSTTATTGNATNSGINPITYTPATSTIAAATGQTYDAADVNDSGTTWNSIESVSTAPTTASVGVTTVLYQTGLPLVDSSGATTPITLSVSAVEGNGKSDFIHTGHNDAAGPDTNSLAPSPANSTSSNGLDGYGGAGAAHAELMGSSWVANGASDGMSFTLNGLTPNGSYNFYVYAAGVSSGQGATFAMSAANGGASAIVNGDTTKEFRSVFMADGFTLVPAGESWNTLVGTADATGSLTFTALASETTGAVKPAVDGFQFQAVTSVTTPEPASLGLLAVGGLALLGRRRKA